MLIFKGDVDININPNEVSSVQYVTYDEAFEIIKKDGSYPCDYSKEISNECSRVWNVRRKAYAMV